MPKSLAMEILGAILASGRTFGRRQYTGPEIERDFKVGQFDRLDLFGPIDVEVRTGRKPGVRANGREDAIELLTVEHDGDRLEIGFDGDRGGGLEIIVSTAGLRSIRVAGSGDVTIDRVKGEQFECATNGSGDLSVDEIEVERLKLAAVGSGDIRIDKARSTEIEASLTGSGDLAVDAIESSALKLTIDGSGDAAFEDYTGLSLIHI